VTALLFKIYMVKSSSGHCSMQSWANRTKWNERQRAFIS